MRPLRVVSVPYSVHTGGKSEAQLTKKQAVLLMHDIYERCTGVVYSLHPARTPKKINKLKSS